MNTPLLSILPNSSDLLALEPEELAEILIEVIPNISQPGGFTVQHLMSQVFRIQGGGYDGSKSEAVSAAFAEALSWLIVEGIVVLNPSQTHPWYMLTRRGRKLKSRVDVEAYRKGHILPIELLPESLAGKVHHLFLRGDHDTAVFQAFKEVEIAVRAAAHLPDELVGRDLMMKAFHPENGPLRNPKLVKAERDSEMFLFSGAIGHCKNPVGHREVNVPPQTAARLIVFAGHLLDIVVERVLV